MGLLLLADVVAGGWQVLMDVLMGKRVQLDVSESAFWRRLGGEQSPLELELALQMVHRLFTHSVQPVPEELATCLRCVGTSASPPLACCMCRWEASCH